MFRDHDLSRGGVQRNCNWTVSLSRQYLTSTVFEYDLIFVTWMTQIWPVYFDQNMMAI